jgi:hypothetical protein
MAEGDTLVNAAIGGAVAIVTSVLLGPASPVVGGAVSGYLQRGDTKEGAIVGAVAGGITLVPFLLFAGLFAVVGIAPVIGVFATIPVETIAGAPEGVALFGGGVFVLFFVFALVTGALLIVGFGALGGIVGAYAARETDIEI